MKTLFNKTIFGCMACCATALALASCSNDDDNWAPGEQVAAGVTGAYFSTSVATGYSTMESTDFEIEVSRLDTTQAATVGVHLVSRDTTSIELLTQQVEFAKGASKAKIMCRAEGLPEPTTDADGNTVNHYYSLTLAIDSADWNPYAAGTQDFTATVVNGTLWHTVADNAYCYFYTTTTLPSYYGNIEQYLNENQFRFSNFMGSGADWYFRIQSADESLYYADYTNLEGDVSTWMGSVDFEYDEYHSYNYDGYWIYFMPDMENEVYGWKVPGADMGYASFASYADYAYIDFSQKYFYTWAYGLGDDEASTNTSAYFYAVW